MSNQKTNQTNNVGLIVFILFLFLCFFLTGNRTKNKTNTVAPVNVTQVAYAETVVQRQTTEFVIPPQPHDQNGNLKCTKNRYVQGEHQIGYASWYKDGEVTANGEAFDKNANTLAHLTLPMGTEVIVENLQTGRTEYARVNDCGPYVKGRIADLSKGLAQKLGVTGVNKVIIHVI